MPYFQILLECAWKASVIPLGDDTTFFAMKAFGNYNMTVPFLLAVTGATIGQLLNLLIGKFLLTHKSEFKISDYWYDRVSTLFNKYGLFLLLLSWVPLCNVLVVLAGFIGVRPKVVMTLVLAGEIFNYGSVIL